MWEMTKCVQSFIEKNEEKLMMFHAEMCVDVDDFMPDSFDIRLSSQECEDMILDIIE